MSLLRSLFVLSLCLAACGGESPPVNDDAADDDSGGIPTVSVDDDGSSSGTPSDDDADDDGPKLDLEPMGWPDAGTEVDCDPLVATVRDFRSDHPDFEVYSGDGASMGLVMPMLGADLTPQLNAAYAGTPMITSAATFADWYHDVAGTNIPVPIELVLEADMNGLFLYDSNAFFPLDGQGFGNEDNDHNFHFTTEVHTSFTYQGGEVFTFRGDDDLWLFVDGQLALDIGGLHPAVQDEIEMDTLGLTPGETYTMDIFHAERHTNESNFRIETTIACFVTPPPPG
jgi:fibro-slime domain-containing protein